MNDEKPKIPRIPVKPEDISLGGLSNGALNAIMFFILFWAFMINFWLLGAQ